MCLSVLLTMRDYKLVEMGVITTQHDGLGFDTFCALKSLKEMILLSKRLAYETPSNFLTKVSEV